jgi:hypothetical protein
LAAIPPQPYSRPVSRRWPIESRTFQYKALNFRRFSLGHIHGVAERPGAGPAPMMAICVFTTDWDAALFRALSQARCVGRLCSRVEIRARRPVHGVVVELSTV